jgi:hypothetical protein
MSAARANKYPAPCAYCGEDVPARAGLLRKAREPRVNTCDGPGGLQVKVSYWEVTHRPPTWTGSPVSGRWVGGCPTEHS